MKDIAIATSTIEIDITNILDDLEMLCTNAEYDDAMEKIKETAIERINTLDGAVNIYTDGPASGGTTDGGAAAIITRGIRSCPSYMFAPGISGLVAGGASE